jgi:hypothetical protein
LAHRFTGYANISAYCARQLFQLVNHVHKEGRKMSDATADPIVLSSARWFWWIAGLSLVNTVLFHTGSDVTFVVGLGLTTVTNILFAGQIPIAIVAAAITVGFYFLIGLQAQRERLWAFYVGLVIYVLDAIVFVAFQDWLAVAFHALAIYFIYKGVARLRERARSNA